MDSHGKTHHEDASPNLIPLSKYSNRVELKTLLEQSDGGAGFLGKRVVVGGWVKSSRAVKKESLPPPPPEVFPPPPSSGGSQASPTPSVSCTEIINSRMNIFRKLFDVLSGGGKTYPIFEKHDLAGQKATSPPEYIIHFQINDGSYVSTLQVKFLHLRCSMKCQRELNFIFIFFLRLLLILCCRVFQQLSLWL